MPDTPAADELRTMRLRLVVDQAQRYEAGELALADLSAGIESLISALRDESGDDEGATSLQGIWGGIQIINAVCLDEQREPRPAEEAQVRRDLAQIRRAAEARLSPSA